MDGDRIINENIEGAAATLNSNMNALMEYYTGLGLLLQHRERE